jgi:predicted amidohydrolase
MNSLKISFIQSNIYWNDKNRNLEHYGRLLENLDGKSDLAVLPEMFSTGFSMNVQQLAETNADTTIQTIQKWAKAYNLAVCGSFLAKDQAGKFFNRGFFITPEGEHFFYDKRHLFRMGDENEWYTAGNKPLIVKYKGWNIRLIICYDLRFPVWNRNCNNEYDLLICPANWPAVRSDNWKILLQARALENQCYVCGVNRIGEDGASVAYQGDSMLVDFKGKTLITIPQDEKSIVTATIQKELLDEFRKKFPTWMDADTFSLISDQDSFDNFVPTT